MHGLAGPRRRRPGAGGRQPEVADRHPRTDDRLPANARERSMHDTKRPGLVFAISVAAVAVFGSIGNATEPYPTRPITMKDPAAGRSTRWRVSSPSRCERPSGNR